MSRGKPWTKEDKQIVFENYLTKTKDEILEIFPNRTWRAIKHIAEKFGLKLRNDYELILKSELFKDIDNIKCMKCKNCRRYLPCDDLYFPRDKSCRLGIRSICKECKGEDFGTKDYWTDQETEIILNNYETQTNRYIQINFLPHKSIVQIAHRAAHLEIYKNEETRYLSRIETQTDEWRNKISQTSIKNGSHKGENNSMYGTSRRGRDNPNWQGGISELYQHLRRNLTQWKLDSAKDCDYKCILTGLRFDDIHHLHSFHMIVEETLRELNLNIRELISEYSDDELTLLTDKCIELHYTYPFGVCLTMDIHNLFHAYYGYFNNTKDQFEEFKERYIAGEFKEVS